MLQLNKRARLALEVGAAKQASGLSLCDHTREREVIESMCAANEGPLDDRAVVELFRAIIRVSRRIQTLAAEQAMETIDVPRPSELTHRQGRLSWLAIFLCSYSSTPRNDSLLD